MLLRKPESVRLAAMAHEMAHERQRFCRIDDGSPRWSRGLFSLEWEAEAEARGYLMDNGPSKAAIGGLIASAVRAALAAALPRLWASPVLGTVVVVLLVSVVLLVPHVWMSVSFPSAPAVRLVSLPLFGCAVSLLLYKFLSGIRLSFWYARRRSNERS